MGLEVHPTEPSSAPSGARRGAAKVAAVLAVLVLLALAHRFGILQQFAEPARVARSLRELGFLGGAVFVLAYALLQPFGVPGTVFILAAPLIWPWPVAFALSMIGTMAASVIGFSFARFVARDWVAGRIPARFRKYDRALAKRAFTTVFVLRFVFWMPQLLHAFLGVSKVRFWTHFWASLAGYAMPLFLVSFFGQRLFDLLKRAPPSVWLAVAASAVALIFITWLRHQRTSAS
jgi:uncharacterized membrane protein YdjX (TVP38/TMEM64 family)